jgi:hypothetical protein
VAVTDPSIAVATYLAGVPDGSWSDLEGLAGDVLGRFAGLRRADLERGIAISLEIARARTATVRTARQERIAAVLADGGVEAAVADIAAEWAGHAVIGRSAG